MFLVQFLMNFNEFQRLLVNDEKIVKCRTALLRRSRLKRINLGIKSSASKVTTQIWPSFSHTLLLYYPSTRLLVFGSRIKLHSVAWMQSISVVLVNSKWKHLSTVYSIRKINYQRTKFSKEEVREKTYPNMLSVKALII